MDDLTQFLNSVEASARKIIKQQSRRAQELAIRERAALTKSGIANSNSTKANACPANSIPREELRAKYTPGGALIVRASSPSTDEFERQPQSPANGRRSEHASDSDVVTNTCNLPKINSPTKAGSLQRQEPTGAPLSLPALDKRRKPLVKPSASSPTKKNPNAAKKILESPLYKSLAAAQAAAEAPTAFGGTRAVRKTLQDVDQVSILLRKMGLRDAGIKSPAARPDHAVEKRMCNACWAHPDKVTGCEHHPRVMPTSNVELQGPLSWQSGDLYVKYRSESDRETLWAAFVQLREQQQQNQLNDDQQPEMAVPEVTRHPVWAKFVTLLELENLRSLAETRRRNLTKTFIFDVNHLWLTNLDHFNVSMEQTRLESEAEKNSLQGRRDDAAVRNGYSQIPSISTARALTHAKMSGNYEPAGSSRASPQLEEPPMPTRRRRKRQRDAFYPLSLLVCGYQAASSSETLKPAAECIADALEQVPGLSLVGSRPVLWWHYPPDRELELELSRRHGSNDPKAPPVELTKVAAMFARDAIRSSSNAILVSLLICLDTPILAPKAFAWHVGSKMPPPCPTTSVAPPPRLWLPLRVAPPGILVTTRLETRLNSMLPCTIMLLNCMSNRDDHLLVGSDASLAVPNNGQHRRGWAKLNPDAFRQWLRLSASMCLVPDQVVPLRDVGVSAATPNAPHVGGRYCWHETRPVALGVELTRFRVARDYLYIVVNVLARGGSNDGTLFAIQMAHERMLDVRNCGKLAEYMAMLARRKQQEQREQELKQVEAKLAAGRLLLEAKRQEQQRIEAQLQVAAARAQDRLEGHHHGNSEKEEATTGTGDDGREWQLRVDQSVVLTVQGGWEQREMQEEGGVIFYRSVNSELPARHRFRWEPPVGWENVESVGESTEANPADAKLKDETNQDKDGDSDSDEEETDALAAEHAKNTSELANMARELLRDTQFLALLKEKLGLPADLIETNVSSSKKSISGGSQEHRVGQQDVLARLGLAGNEEKDVADGSKAALLASRMAKLTIPVHPEARRRVDKPGEGWKRLARCRLPQDFARRVYRPRVEAPRSAFINQTNHATPVGMLDPTEWSVHDPPEFIPELRAVFVPKASSDLAEKKAQWAEYERRLRLERPVAAAGPRRVELEEPEPLEEQEQSMEQLVAKAVLCARNNNLEGVRGELSLEEESGLTSVLMRRTSSRPRWTPAWT